MAVKKILLLLFSFILLAFISAWMIIAIKLEPIRVATFVYTAYFIMLALFMVWLISLIKLLSKYKEAAIKLLKDNRNGILFCLGLTVLVGLTVPSYFRMLADEANLMSVSRSMTFEHTADNVIEGYWHNDSFFRRGAMHPKRPTLYPLLVHFLHSSIGYRISNAFLLNHILYFVLITMVFLFVNRICGPPWGYVGVLLVASNPILSMSANSGGFDLLYTVFFYINILLVGWYLKNKDPKILFFLHVSLIMFLNTRYEAIVSIGIIYALLLVYKLIDFSHIKKYAIHYALSLFFILPTIWQRSFSLNEVTFNTSKKKINFLFNADNFVQHQIAFLESVFKIRFDFGASHVICALGVIGALTFLYLLIKKKIRFKETYQEKWFIIFTACITFLWICINTYQSGDITFAPHTRYFQIFLVAFGLATTWFIYRIKYFKKSFYKAVVAAVVVFLIYHPTAMESRGINHLVLIREYRFVSNYFTNQPDKRFLVIYDRPNFLTIHHIGAVMFRSANRYAKQHLGMLKNNLIHDIFVVQRISLETGEPAEEAYELDKRYELEEILEIMNGEDFKLRISRVTNFDKK